MFPDGGCLHNTIKNAAQCITCLPIKPNNIINIKCDLFFDNSPEYNITDKELDYEPNASIMHLSVYTYQRICATHGLHAVTEHDVMFVL